MNLEHRVVELERRAIRYRNALMLLVLVICAVAVVGATTDDGVIEGRVPRIVNEDGALVFGVRALAGRGVVGLFNESGERSSAGYAARLAGGDC